MLKTIAISAVAILGVAIVVILVLATLKPDTFRVQRSARIKAPPESIFAMINDFDRWGAWSPYEAMDPGMKRSRSGPTSGPGAVYGWESSKVGTGRMEITGTAPPSKVTIKLDFAKPFEAHNVAEFMMDPQPGATGAAATDVPSTQVTWAMHGPNTFVGRLISVFIDMDRMVGKDFETGLANLKTLAERPAAAQ